MLFHQVRVRSTRGRVNQQRVLTCGSGGEEFKDKNMGVAHSGWKAKFADGKSVMDAGNFLTYIGASVTPASSMFSVLGDRVNNFATAADLLHGAFHNNEGTPGVKTDTTAWFWQSSTESMKSRTIPMDSLPFFHVGTIKDSKGYYNYGLQSND